MIKYFIMLILFPAAIWGQSLDADEDSMFTGNSTVVDRTDNSSDAQEQKKFSISGEINSVSGYMATHDFVLEGESKDNILDSYVVGTFFADARLTEGFKGFGSFEASYNAVSGEKEADVKELFISFNINHAAYFQSGKQVLQWGRCYMWNPTDLINIEKKAFIDTPGAKEGVYGLKMHIPFGTKFNIYSFTDLGEAGKADEIAGAGKLEVLIGTTEIALSGWGKKGYEPVAGLDFSTKILKWDILGEASVSKGSNVEKLAEKNGILFKEKSKDIIAKACIDLGRTFDIGDNKDKFRINMEFFYNGDGYEENILDDSDMYIYEKDVTIEDSSGNEITLPGGEKKYFLLGNNMYEPNYYSRYYAALFTTINKFIISELAYNLNVISNIEQKSFMISTGVNYQNLSDFNMSLMFTGYVGERNTEYTFHERGVDVLLTFGVVF